MPKIVCATVEGYQSDDRYDAIILQNILEHVEEPPVILRALGKLLVPKGRFYISVPLANSLHRLLGVELGMITRPDDLSETDIQYGHYRVYTPESIRQHIESAGLDIIFQTPFYLKPFSTDMLRHLSDAQHTALFNLGRKVPDFASYYYMEARIQ